MPDINARGRDRCAAGQCGAPKKSFFMTFIMNVETHRFVPVP